MLSCRKILRLSMLNWPRKAVTLNSVYKDVTSKNHLLYAPFCATPESLSVTESTNVEESLSVTESMIVEESYELPNWVKYCEHDNPSVNESDDDFVLPQISEWADSRKLSGEHSNLVRIIDPEIMDADLNKLSNILKGQFDSIDAVGSMLSVCGGIELSESLVEKVLLRFRHDWIPAFGFFNWAKTQVGYKHTANCYNLMVDFLGMSRKFELMWELIDEMHKLGGLVSLATMTKAMRRLTKCGNYDAAVDAFDNFERFGVMKETSAMNMLIEALVKERNVERAQKVYLEFKDKIQPNLLTFNILIGGWCRAKKYSEAKQVMADIEKHGFQPDVFSYTCFIGYHCRKKDFRKVDGVLDEMQRKGCRPNVVTYTIIMRALGEAKQLNEALEICQKMKQSGCEPDASFYSALIYLLNKSGRYKDACNIFDNMPPGVPDLLTYNTMIAAACTHSREEYAIQLLKEMEEKSCNPNIKTYTPLLKICCEKKWMKVLNYLLADMFKRSVGLDLSTYSLLVDHLCKSGKLEHACYFFEQMVLKGMVPRDKTYTMLVEELKKKSMGKAHQQIETLMLNTQNSPM